MMKLLAWLIVLYAAIIFVLGVRYQLAGQLAPEQRRIILPVMR